MFAPKNVWGTPTRFVVKASKPSSNSSVYKNYRGQGASTPYGPKYSLLKVDLGGSKLTCCHSNFVDSEPKFTGLLSSNTG